MTGDDEGVDLKCVMGFGSEHRASHVELERCSQIWWDG